VYEKIGTYGKRIVPAAGFVLIAWAILIALHPAWLPPTFSGR
jgi:hypothetical protein